MKALITFALGTLISVSAFANPVVSASKAEKQELMKLIKTYPMIKAVVTDAKKYHGVCTAELISENKNLEFEAQINCNFAEDGTESSDLYNIKGESYGDALGRLVITVEHAG